MKISKNPYPKTITDECSGIQVENLAHKIWAEGYRTGRKDERVKKGQPVYREMS